jgi:glucokinase
MPGSNALLLAGDLGGTNFRVAVFRDGMELTRLHEAKFRSAEHSSLEEMVRLFLGGITLDSPLEAACFGIPGPNVGGIVIPTNLGWKIEINALPGLLGVPRVAALNDLEATAYGLSELRHTDLALLQAGSGSRAGNQCVIAPGTGLGEAGLFWDGKRHTPWACEGGHADFAPTDDLQQHLLDFLHREFGCVSFERIVSGTGIPNIYRFLRDTGRGIEQDSVAREMLSSDPAGVISRHATEETCPLCCATMDLFVRTLGAEAANLALKTMATGGVFIAGGIPPKILPFLRRPIFLESFLNKGRMRPLMESMPLNIVLNDEAALLGSARRASRMLEDAGSQRLKG